MAEVTIPTEEAESQTNIYLSSMFRESGRKKNSNPWAIVLETELKVCFQTFQ